MESVIYVQAHSQFSEKLDDKSLRQMLKNEGIDGRRFSRFTNLALLGLLPLKAQIPSNSALFLASSFNSPSKFDKMFDALMQHNLPSPLDFMANLGNATTFQIAQTLQLTGPSVFLAIDKETAWQPLWLAFNELMAGVVQTAVVGWAYENGITEGGEWLVLSKNPQNAIGELKLSELKQFKPIIGIAGSE